MARCSTCRRDRLIDRATNHPTTRCWSRPTRRRWRTAGDLKLLAGMPAEVYIKGEERTPLQYLVEPVTQVLRRAARER